MANNFFSGCETWMEDAPVQEDDVSIAEVIESVTQASEEIEQDHEFTHEINTVVDQATMLAAKAAELDRMAAYVKAYGVDRSFLSLCNHHNQLATLGMQMPACESFDAVGDPKSATSQAALEGLAQGVRTVWEYIKKIIGRCVDWLARILRFSDVRRALINRRIAKLKEIKVSDLAEISEGKDRRIPGLNYLQANIAKLKGITDEDLKALKESSDNVAHVVENDAGKETDYHTSLTNLADKAPITLNRFTAAAQDPLLFATDSLSDTKTSDFPKYVSLAEEAMKRFDEIFKRISDIRNQLSKLKIERAGMDSDSEDAKAKTKAIKQYTIYLKRAKLFFIFPLHLASRACTAAEAIAKTRKKSSSGTESFDYVSGMESILPNDIEKALLPIRDAYLQEYTAMRRWFQSLTQSETGVISRLNECKKKIRSMKSFPDVDCYGFSKDDLDKWMKSDPNGVLQHALTSLADMQHWNLKDPVSDDADYMAEELERNIEKVEKGEPNASRMSLSEIKPSDMIKYIDYALKCCATIVKVNDTYAGWWKTGFNQGKLPVLLKGPLTSWIMLLVTHRNVYRVARTSWRNMNTTSSICFDVFERLISMSKTAIGASNEK